MNKNGLITAISIAFALAGGSAGAATTQTWELNPGDTSSPYANTWTFVNANSKSLTLRAYYADGLLNTTGTVGDSAINTTLRDSTQAKNLKTNNGTNFAGVGSFGGNGVGISNPYDGPQTNGQESSTGGQHAIDNYDWNGSTNSVHVDTTQRHAHDFLLMDFVDVMALGDFRIGWKKFDNTDIDFFVAPETLTTNLDLTGTNINTLISNGWTKVSFNNVSDCVPDPMTAACPTQFSSGSGYNAGLKGRYLIAAGALGGNDDAFKFSQITMNSPGGGSTPIPGTAALLAIGIAGLAWNTRRPKKQK